MRATIILMLVLAAAAVTLMACPPLRLKVEGILFGKKAEPAVATNQANAAPAAPKDPAAAASTPQAAPEGNGTLGRIAEEFGALVEEVRGAPPQAATAPASPAGSSGTAQTPSQGRPANAPPKAAGRVALPPALRQAQFGTPAEQIKRAYPAAWTKEELGEVMLTHYPTPDKSTTVRFHFSGDSLYRIEVRLTPAKGQTRKQLYDSLQAYYAQFYAHAPEQSATRWSDGSVTAQIKSKGEGVELIFVCPVARR